MEYRVIWEIDVDANGYIAAATKAREIQRDLSSKATIFDAVERETGQCVRVDLDPEAELPGYQGRIAEPIKVNGKRWTTINFMPQLSTICYRTPKRLIAAAEAALQTLQALSGAIDLPMQDKNNVEELSEALEEYRS